jgi:hypothetical protein
MILNGYISVEGRRTPCCVTDEHSASSYGIPVVTVGGEPVDPHGILCIDYPEHPLSEPGKIRHPEDALHVVNTLGRSWMIGTYYEE